MRVHTCPSQLHYMSYHLWGRNLPTIGLYAMLYQSKSPVCLVKHNVSVPSTNVSCLSRRHLSSDRPDSPPILHIVFPLPLCYLV